VLALKNGAVDQLAEDLVKVVLEQESLLLSSKKDDSLKTPRRIPIFGAGHKHRLAEQFGIEHSFSVPLMDQISANGDAGTPYVLEYPDSTQAKIYHQLAGDTVLS
jgi:hypothetical protein